MSSTKGSKKGASGSSSLSDLPDKSRTITICLAAIGLLVAVMHGAGELIRASPSLIIGAGFLSSIVFFFLVVLLGAWTDSSLGWTYVLLALLVSAVNAGLVHRICVTVCIIFSVGVLFFLNYISSTVYSKGN